MTTSTARSQQREETHERLFEAAVEEFLAVGFAAARIERIVEKAGVARGTFYFHFSTKDHVLFELTDRMGVMIAEGLDLPDDAPLEDVLRLTFAVVRGSDESLDPGLQRELLAAQLRRPPQPGTPPLQRKLADALARAQARGEVRAELDAAELAHTLLTSIFGAIALSHTEPDPGRALEVLLDTFLHGTLTPQTRH